MKNHSKRPVLIVPLWCGLKPFLCAAQFRKSLAAIQKRLLTSNGIYIPTDSSVERDPD